VRRSANVRVFYAPAQALDRSAVLGELGRATIADIRLRATTWAPSCSPATSEEGRRALGEEGALALAARLPANFLVLDSRPAISTWRVGSWKTRSAAHGLCSSSA
jgi:hypothetical protein